MDFISRLQLYDRLHHLIRRHSTGTPKDLAAKFNVSERTVYNMIDILRDYGAEICYCRKRNSFYYAREVSFSFNPVLSSKAEAKVTGGLKYWLRWPIKQPLLE